jgi:outer membrane protein assembly factor BamE (lipoprotein component of BamABCDE complex)
MNTRIPSLLVLAAALSTSALSAASKDTPAIAYSVSAVTSASSGFEKVSPGATQGTVVRVLGAPALEMSPDVWVYHNYHANLALANEQGCDTVVITFAQGKVADLKLVNHPAATYLAANVKIKSVRMIASSK